jgi:chemotaxis protein methyltransferase CheR
MTTEKHLEFGHRLSHTDFITLSEIVYKVCGIKLEVSKKTMVEGRLSRRLRALNLKSFTDYVYAITKNQDRESELIQLVDAISTNKTDFFREPHHFEFLEKEILPSFLGRPGALKVWSAACSSGEEPYTLAMVLESVKEKYPGFTYEILASDVSTAMLGKGIEAIYSMDRAVDIPLYYRKKYLLKSKDSSNPRIRISSTLRKTVTFSRINLIEKDDSIDQLQDIIFCRNVLIYFDRATQLNVIHNLLSKLRPGGYLFIGHSESLHFFELPIRQIRPTIFVKDYC